MSSLSLQLRALSTAAAAPSSAALSHPSLLFSPAVAGDQSVESIYHLAVNGLQELVELQPSLFSPFSSSLFHPSTVSLDRAAQKPHTQQALHRSVSTFLSRLSPLFLHPAAVQCLEYLLRRYEAHVHEAMELLDMALPYFDTHTATRLFPLLHLHRSPATSAFAFLQQRGASPAPLSRSSLLSAAAREPAVFLRILQVSRAQPHAAQLGLLVSVGVELLSCKDGAVVEGELLQASLAALLDGLDVSSHHSLELHAASLILLVATARTHTLDEAVLESVVHRLVLSLSREPASVDRSLAALSSLLQAQRPAGLSLRCLAPLLASSRQLLPALRALVAARSCGALLRLLLSSAISAFVSLSLPAASHVESVNGDGAVARSSDMTASDALTFIRRLLSSHPLPHSPSPVPQLLELVLKSAVGAAEALASRGPAHMRGTAAEASSTFSSSGQWQLPAPLLLGLSEVWRLLDSEQHWPAVDEWMKASKARQGERDRRREAQAMQALQRRGGHVQQPQLQHNSSTASVVPCEAAHSSDGRTTEDGESVSRAGKKRRKSTGRQQSSGAVAATTAADGEADEAEAEESVEGEAEPVAAVVAAGEGRKRRRREERRSLVLLGSSASACRSLLLAILTRGSRHSVVAAPHAGASPEVGSVWQCVWSDNDNERVQGLNALQRLQVERDSSSAEPSPLNPSQVEEAVGDVLLHSSSSPALVRHTLALAPLLSSIPTASLQRLLLRFLRLHTAQLRSSTASLARLSASLLRCAFTFLSSTLLPRHPSLLLSFLPFYLEHSLVQPLTAKLNLHVQALMAGLQHASPLFAQLQPPAASSSQPSPANASSSASAVEDGNQRWVQLLATAVWKDRSDQLLAVVLRVFEGQVEDGDNAGDSDGADEREEGRPWPVGLWCSGLVLSLAVELRQDERLPAARADLPLLTAFARALMRHFALLHSRSSRPPSAWPSASSHSTPPPFSSSTSPSSSFFSSVSSSTLPSFLRYLLDRLLLCLTHTYSEATTTAATGQDAPLPPSSLVFSPRALLMRELLVFLLSSPSLPSMRTQVAHLLAGHLRSPSEVCSVLLPLLFPSSSSASPSLLCSLRAVHLTAALLEHVGSVQGRVGSVAASLLAEPLLVPALLALAADDSSALRRAAFTALTTWQQRTTHKRSTAAPLQQQPQPRHSAAWSVLVAAVLQRGEEVVSDGAAVSAVLSSLSSSASGASACAALMAAAADVRLPHFRMRLLSLLQAVPSLVLFDSSCGLLQQLLTAAAGGSLCEQDAASLALLMQRVQAAAVSDSARADAALGLLVRALSAAAPLALLAVAQLQAELFRLLTPPQRSTLMAALIRCLLSPSSTAELVNGLSRCLASLPLSASDLLPFLSLERGEAELSAALDVLSAQAESLTDAHELLTPLCSTLSQLLERAELADRGEELKQAVLHSLTRFTRNLHRSGAASTSLASVLDVDAVLGCLAPPPHASSSSSSTSPTSSLASLSSAELHTRVAALSLLSTVAPLLPSSASASLLAPLFGHLAQLPWTGSGADSSTSTLSLLESTMSSVLPVLLPAPAAASSMSPQAWSIASTFVQSATLTASSAPQSLQLLSHLIRCLSTHSLHIVVLLLLVRAVREQAELQRVQDKRARRREEKTRKKARTTTAAAAAALASQEDAAKQLREAGEEAALDHSAFIHALLDGFSPQQQLDCLVHCAQRLQAASAPPSTPEQPAPLSFQSSGERSEWHRCVLQLMASHLSHLPFVSALLDLSPAERSGLQSSYLALFQQLLAVPEERSDEDSEAAVEAAEGEGGSSPSSSLSSAVSAALAAATELLPVASFVALMAELLHMGAAPVVVARSLRLVQSKLAAVSAQHSQQAAAATAEATRAVIGRLEEERQALLPLVQPLVELLPTGGQPWPASSREQLAVWQLCLSCLQSLASAVCARLPFVRLASSSSLPLPALLQSRRQRLLSVLVRVQALLSHPSAPLTASALLCLSALLDALELTALPQLPSLLPAVLELASSPSTRSPSVPSSSPSAHSAVRLASLMVVRAMVDALPSFLSPYLQRLLLLFLQPHFHSAGGRGEARELVYSTAAELIRMQPPAAVLTSLSSAFPSAVALGRRSLSFLVGLLAQLLQRLSAEELRVHLQPILALLAQQPFQLRQRHAASLSWSDVGEVEDEAVSALVLLVLKMNEGQLKLTFHRLLDWLGAADAAAVLAPLTAQPSAVSPAGREQLLCRGVVLFKLSAALAERLQSLFVPYALLALEPALHLLHTIAAEQAHEGAEADCDDGEREREAREKGEAEEAAVDGPSSSSSPTPTSFPSSSSLLLPLIFSTLQLSLSFDTHRLWGKEQLDRLLPALRLLLHSPSCWPPSFVSASLAPLCSQLAVSLSHFHLWKATHQTLLSAAAHQQPQVRLAVLQTVRAMFDAVGSRYLVLLPETLPALNEWLEDEDVEVEREAQRLVHSIEQQSGESLDQYLEG